QVLEDHEAGEATPAQSGASQDKAPLDGAGLPIPADMRDAFATCAKYDECKKHLRAAHKLMHEIASGPGGGHLLMRRRSHKSNGGERPLRHECDGMVLALHKLDDARPFACACPYCLDAPKQSCKSCLGNGWVVESCWNNAPEDKREAAASLRQEVP